MENIMEDETDSNGATHTALRNELVLSEIFKFFGIKTLLCCSLVNKHWKNQVHTYLRDHRKCTILIQLNSSSSSGNHRQMIRRLNEAFGLMEVVPFNSLNIVVEPHRHRPETRLRPSLNSEIQPQDLGAVKIQWEKLFSKIHLKFLAISWDKEVTNCPAASLIYLLLLEKASEIKCLEFFPIPQSFDESLCRQKKKRTLQFPKLEEFKIQRFRDWTGRRDLLIEILDGSPKLKKIIHDGLFWILTMIPDNKYKLLEKLTLLRYEKEMDSVDLFENLRWFGLNCWHKRGDFQDAYSRIKFGVLFPKLETIELKWDEPVMYGFREAPQFDDKDENAPDRHWESDSPHTSKTASKLILRGDACNLSYSELKYKFPELTELEIFPAYFDAHEIPYLEIFRFWPKLKKLVLSGTVGDKNANVDQVFCGVHQEELKLLWKYGEEHLRKLHIVPVRPCLSTMSRLKSIQVSLNFECQQTLRTRPSMFLSPVTQILVFERMPWLDVRLDFPLNWNEY